MPSALDTFIARVADEQLRADLRAAVGDLRKVTDFGLVFEAHIPETVRLPQHSIRRGIKVALRDLTDQSMFEVVSVNKTTATIRRLRHPDGSSLSQQEAAEVENEKFPLSSVVALAEFGDAIYPGMRHLGSVQRGGIKAAHVVIKGENHHVLEALQFTHAGKIDCIYIDPPYNTGARDWKYNNDYVDKDDGYRHSKWLAFMDRRLKLAKTLLNPTNSVLIVTVDENELHRLGMLLQQVFRGCRIQMVTSVINPRGKYRDGEFSRCEEQIFFVMIGDARVLGESDQDFGAGSSVGWRTFRRSDLSSARGTQKGGPRQFYPIYVDDQTKRIVRLGAPLEPGVPRDAAPVLDGCTAVFPVRDDGTEMNWGLTADGATPLLEAGYLRIGKHTPKKPQLYEVSYLTAGRIADITAGRAEVVGYEEGGAAIIQYVEYKLRMPLSTWSHPSHNAEVGGTNLIKSLLGDKRFDYPKSLYAVEDAIRYFVQDKPEAIILDFFGGSGTTTHAVARLNHEDAGRRRSILITNNEVAEDEAKALRRKGLCPGDEQWESLGIFEHVARPRITAAITGRAPDGEPLAESYRFRDEFAMRDGFEENVEFFELTYLDSAQIEVDLAFAGIAPLLWLRAGGRGPIIDECLDAAGRRKPYAWTEQYGVLYNTDRWRSFISKLPDTVTTVYIVTDSITEFSHIAGELPGHLDVVRLYERYLSTFTVNGR